MLASAGTLTAGRWRRFSTWSSADAAGEPVTGLSGLPKPDAPRAYREVFAQQTLTNCVYRRFYRFYLDASDG